MAMRDRLPVLTMAIFFVLVQSIALLLASIFPQEYAAFPDANDPTNPLIYIIMILVVTGVILILIRYGKQRILQAVFMFSIFVTLLYVFLPLLLAADLGAWIAILVSLALAASLIILLIVHGEWYVIDAVGLIVACGVTAILGLSLGILPTLILLIILAVYDAIAVYRTKHMISLAEGVVPMRLPVLFVVPRDKSFSMSDLEGKSLVKKEGEEREAMFMGVGDAVIPGILVVSASIFLPSEPAFVLGGNIWAAIGALLGGLGGFAVLMSFVLRGKPQAGLPFLNSGAILGYIIAYLLVFRDLGLGIVI
jgi:presenilin-like A22 family membrane protease